MTDRMERFANPTDFNRADVVHITIDGDKVWVDVDGLNRFRCYNAKQIVVTDRSEMPWCEHCECYHSPKAEHITKELP